MSLVGTQLQCVGALARNVQRRPNRIAAALMTHAVDVELDEAARQRLELNGFRLVRVPVDDLELLREDLGGTSFDAEGRHRESKEWVSVTSRPLGRAPAD